MSTTPDLLEGGASGLVADRPAAPGAAEPGAAGPGAAGPGAAGPGVRAARRFPRLRLVGLHLQVSVVLAAVWLAVGPVSGPYQNHVAELLGLEAIWLMASSVLVLTRSRRLERVAGGVELEIWWHRVAGALGIMLGFVHPRFFVPEAGVGASEPSPLAGLLNLLSLVAALLVGWAFMTPTSRAGRWRGPLGWLARRGYDRWRSVHSLLFVYVVIAMAHGVVDSRTLSQSPVLLVTYATVCAVGLVALVERLVLARVDRGLVGATVASVTRVGDIAVLRVLPDRPVRRGVAQWISLDVPASGERPHPFTVVSTPDDPMIEVAVKVAGPGTGRIVDGVAVGDRVRVGAVRGLPDAPSSGPELWLASGVGITPFVARLRARAAALGADGSDGPDAAAGAGTAGRVDLVWTRRGFADAPYLDELVAAARDLPWFTLHLRDTAVDGRLDGDAVLALTDADPAALTVLACGSPMAIRPLADALVARGVPRRAVTTEAFGFR